MRTRFAIVPLFAFIAMRASAADVATSPTLTLPAPGQTREITAEEFDRLTKQHGKQLLVVNFWATWCLPCVEELPHFIKAHEQLKQESVQFIGISLDFLDERTTGVDPFLKKNKIAYPNYILNADQNEFLTRFPKEWSGALPATFLYDSKGNLLAHHLKPLTEAELMEMIKSRIIAPR